MCPSVLAPCFPGKFIMDSGNPVWVCGQDTDGEGRVVFGALFLMTHNNTSRTLLMVPFPAATSITGCKHLCSSAKMALDSFAKANNPLKNNLNLFRIIPLMLLGPAVLYLP